MTEAGLSLIVRRTLPARPERVFAAWTDPTELAAWWGPGPVKAEQVLVDLRVGGGYRIGNRMPDGRVVWIKGAFIEIQAPSLLVYTWTLGDGEETRVTVRFEPAGEATELTIIHERLSDPATRDEHAEGWSGCLDKLAAYIAR